MIICGRYCRRPSGGYAGCLGNIDRRSARCRAGRMLSLIHICNGARAELRPGDVILALIARGESTEVRSAEQFNRLLAQFDKSASVTLLVRRGDMQTFVTIRPVPDRSAE